ncbi:MAG: hypothetical protein ABSA91_19195 [Acidimicrobiales bacterium]
MAHPDRPAPGPPKSALGGESLRQEAARRGVGVGVVRRERAAEMGYPGAAGTGHAGGLRAQVSLGGVLVDRHGALVEVSARGPAEAARLGAYLHDRRSFLSGELPSAAFDRKWAGRSIGGVRVGGTDQTLAAVHGDDEGLAREVRYERRGR